MSRYVSIEVELAAYDELLACLAALELPCEVADAGESVMLEGSLECAGEPVQVRLPPGTLGAVEDFGFVAQERRIVLVCGELDRSRLERELLPQLRRQATLRRAQRLAASEGIELEQHIEPDGTHRLVLKRND